MVQVTLIPLAELETQESFLLDDFPVIIGRGFGVHVRLHDRCVS